MFWSAICSGKVKRTRRNRNDHTVVKDDIVDTSQEYTTLSFEAKDVENILSWDLLTAECSVIIERPEYIRVLNMLVSSKEKLALLEGTQGVGKSAFMAWLMYKVCSESKSSTFVLIHKPHEGGNEVQYYYFGYDHNNTPVVCLYMRQYSVPPVDYVLSDTTPNLNMTAKKFQLFVASYGVNSEIASTYYRKAVDSGREVDCFVMSVCEFFEIDAMLQLLGCTGTSNDIAIFMYTLVGGSARLAVRIARIATKLADSTDHNDLDYRCKVLVEQALQEWVGGSKYALAAEYSQVCAAAVLILTKELSREMMHTTDITDLVTNYLFQHMVVTNNTACLRKASTYMTVLANIILKHNQQHTLYTLQYSSNKKRNYK